MLRKIARETFIYDIYEFFYRFMDNILEKRSIDVWIKEGERLPVPHAVKRKILRGIVVKNRIKTFVETGTYKGYMIDAVKNIIPEIYSIEIDNFLANKAAERFKRFKNISIINGDSSKEITEIITKLENPTLFWLDAHFSGGITGKGDEDSPLKRELKLIKEKTPAGSIVAIDDIGDCNGQNGYPSLEEIMCLSNKHELKNNIAVLYL